MKWQNHFTFAKNFFFEISIFAIIEKKDTVLTLGNITNKIVSKTAY